MSLFSSPFDRLVESPTDERLGDVDWLANLELVETINRHPEHAKDILKAIRKRLTSSKRQVQYLSVCLLETCVKNCGLEFHLQVANKDSMETLYKVAIQLKDIKHPNGKDAETQEKLLNLIQSLYSTFKDDVRMSAIPEFYGKMLKKGINFPENPNNEAPIITPPLNKSLSQQGQRASQSSQPPMNPAYLGRTNSQPTAGHTNAPAQSMGQSEEKKSSAGPHPLSYISDQYVMKVKNEFCSVLNYCQLLKETMITATSAASSTSDIVLSLAQTVGEIRNRISLLIVELLDNEELLDLCIQMNDIVRLHLEFYQARKNGIANAPPPEFECPPALIPHLPPDMKHLVNRPPAKSVGAQEEEKKAPAAAIKQQPQVSNLIDLDIFSAPAPAPAPAPIPVPAAAAAPYRPVESKSVEPSPLGSAAPVSALSPASVSPGAAVSPASSQPRSPNPFANPAPAPVSVPAPVPSSSSYLPPTVSPLDPFADIIARNSAPIGGAPSNRQEGEPDPFLALAARSGEAPAAAATAKSPSFDPFASQPSFDNPGAAPSIFDDFLQMNPGPGQQAPK